MKSEQETLKWKQTLGLGVGSGIMLEEGTLVGYN